MFYHIEIADGTQAIYAHETYEQAVEAFHYFLYYQMNIKAKSALGIVMDAEGAVYKTEKFTRPEVEEEGEGNE